MEAARPPAGEGVAEKDVATEQLHRAAEAEEGDQNRSWVSSKQRLPEHSFG